jgi:catechol 2,3-dioxygenase-like lactoylglutathione lyase family enzyme
MARHANRSASGFIAEPGADDGPRTFVDAAERRELQASKSVRKTEESMPAERPSTPLPKASFHSVAVVVSDRKRSVAWYTKTFGLDVVQQEKGQGGHWVTVGRKGENGTIHLCQFTEFDPSFPLEPGNSGIQISIPGDFVRACAALKANGVRFRRDPKEESWGWWASVEDPDGNQLMLVPK